jgi:hypothetical protein
MAIMYGMSFSSYPDSPDKYKELYGTTKKVTAYPATAAKPNHVEM